MASVSISNKDPSMDSDTARNIELLPKDLNYIASQIDLPTFVRITFTPKEIPCEIDIYKDETSAQKIDLETFPTMEEYYLNYFLADALAHHVNMYVFDSDCGYEN